MTWTRLLPLLPLILGAIFFEWLVKSGTLPSFLFPAPSQVIEAVVLAQADFLKAFYESAVSSFLGLIIAFGFGFSVAVILAFSNWARKIFYPYAVFFQTVPIIAIAPILVVWLGYGLPTVVASSFIVSVFPIIANSLLGLLSTDPNLLRLFKLLQASRIQVLTKLQIPFALPSILNGVRVAAGLAVIGAIVGEFVSGTGLGGLIDAARNQQRLDRIFAAVGLASLLGILFFTLTSGFNRLLLKNWHPSENK